MPKTGIISFDKSREHAADALDIEQAALMEEVDRELGPKWVQTVGSSASTCSAAPNPRPITVIPPPFTPIVIQHVHGPIRLFDSN